MALYIMLSTLSETGRKVIRKLPGSIRKVNEEVGRMGVKVIAQYAVLGPYDFVTVVEAPDNETGAKVSMELGARGPRPRADRRGGPAPQALGAPPPPPPRRSTLERCRCRRGTRSRAMATRGPI